MRSHGVPAARTETRKPSAPDAANADIAIPVAPRARPALARAALLASVWLGAFAGLTPSSAQTIDGTWLGGGAPVTNAWTQGNNWSSSPDVPDRTATFTNGAPTSVTISSTTSIGTIQFTSLAPAYFFTVNSALFEINGSGIVNSSASAPSFTINAAITFANSSSAGNSAIINNGGGSLVSFTDTSTAGNATITTNNGALTQFGTNSNGGNARFITNAGGTVDFSGTSGPSGNHQITAGSIEGAGTYFLGSNQLTVGSNNLSTIVSGEIQDSGTFGGSGASLVKVGTGTLTLSGNNSYTGATTISAGTLVAASNTALPGQTGLAVNLGATLTISDGVSAQIGSLADGASGGGAVVIGPTDPTALLTIAGSSTTTFSGAFSGAGSLELDDGSLTLTGASNGGNIGTIGGDLTLCNCDNGGVTISGGSFTVGGFVEVDSGTLAVTNGGSLRTTDISVGGTMIVTGAGSTVTASGVTVVGFVGPGALTIANGGVFNSQGGAEIDSFVPELGIPSVLVTGPGSTWNVGGPALFVGNGTSGGPGMLTVTNGGTVNSTAPITIGDVTGASTVTVTGAGSVLNALDSLAIGGSGCGCGPLLGTLTIADGGVVNSPGSTTIAAGSTLNLGTGSLAGAIVTPAIDNEGRIVANFTDTLTLAAAISGAGSLSKAGAGTLILTGTNSYSGGTTINAGTLQLGNGGASGALAGNVVDNGVFAVNRSDTYTFGGVISGTGAFAQIGPGTTILTAGNTYTGATTVSAGTLQAGAANTFAPSSAVTVASGATLNLAGFNQSIGSLAGAGAVTLGAATLTTGNDNTSTTFSGVISASGGLIKTGAGVLTLSGANIYTGGTTIAGGTLSLANNQALGTGALTTTGSVVDYANGVTIANAIVINSNTTQLQVTSGTATQAGVISELNGPRPLEKIGAGALVLTANNTYSGPTTISAGTLVVNGSIANSAVTVGSGATLAGTGTVGATTILAGGIFSPGPAGSPPGSMTVAGSLAFQSGALYVVQVNPANASSDIVTAGGAATLAGTVQAFFASGRYAARTYTILSAAGGLGGSTFSGLTTTNLPAGFAADLSYTNTDVILNLTARLHTVSASGLSINQKNVATALDDFFNHGGTLPAGFVTIFGLTGANLGNALSQLSGEPATGAQQAGFQMESQFLNLMLDPFVDGRSGVGGAAGPALGFAPEHEELPDDIALAYSTVLKAPKAPAAPTFEQRWSVWGGAYGGGNRTSGDPAVVGSHDLSASTAGFAGGLDYHPSRDSVVGFALAGGGTNWSLAQGLGGGKSDAFQAGVYGATRSGPAYLAAAFAYTNHWMSTDRFAFAGDHLTASFDAQSIGGRIESGYRFATFYGGVAPYAAIQAQSFRTPSYAETDTNGGGFALAYNARTATDTRSELGARFDRLIALYPGAALSLRARLAWAYDWVSDPSLAAVFQTLPGASFIVNGATPAKNSALASAGAEYRLANGVTLLAKFDGEFASHSSTYAGTGTVRYTW